jgi:hypothetical protein
VLACPTCQGRMKLLALVKGPASIARYLATEGEATEVPRRSPGRGPPYWKSCVLRRQVLGPESWLADGIVSHNSGAIEQDADIVMFIYREEEYKQTDENRGIAELIIGKQRNGPTGTVKLAFIKELTRFENIAWQPGG